MKKKKWRKGEIPHCEIDHVDMPDKLGDPIVFHLTPRGAAEKERRDIVHKKEQRRIKRAQARGDYGIPVDWLLFGDPVTRAFCSAHKRTP